MIKEGYSYFRAKLERGAEEKHIPLRALFELTYKCNFNCVHCYIPQGVKKQELNTKEVFSMLEQLRDLGCFHLGFSGGEIFLRKDIFKILQKAKKLGFNLTLLTNSSLIDKNIADALCVIAPSKVDITVHSLNPKHFENITRVKGSFKKVFDAIELLHERKIILGIKNCALSQNKNDLEEVKEFANSLGALSRIGGMVLSKLDISCLPVDTDTEILATTPSSKFKKRRVFMCAAGKTALTISPAGEIKLCPQIDYPNIMVNKMNLKNGWHKLVGMVKKIEEEAGLKCYACRLKGNCSWCPAQGWAYSRSLTRCKREIFEEPSQILAGSRI